MLNTDLNDQINIRKRLQLLGFYAPNNKKLRAKLLALTGIYLTIMSFMAMLKNWDDIDLRFRAIEDLSLCAATSGTYLEYLLIPSNMAGLLETIEKRFFFHGFNDRMLTTEKKNMIENYFKDVKKWSDTVWFAVKVFYLNMLIVEVVIRYILIIQNGFKTIEDLPLLIEYAYPSNKATLEMYCAITVLQFIYIVFLNLLGYCIFNSGIISMHRLSTDIRLLILSIEEIDKKYKWIDNINRKSTTESENEKYSRNECNEFEIEVENESINRNEDDLREYTKMLIRHHQEMMRKVRQLNKCIQLTSSIINAVICLFTCIDLYYFIEVDDIILKLKAFLSCIAALFLLLIYSYYGQVITNQAENLRIALWECTWINKPLWFQKTLLLMMTCANKTLTVKPFGLYILNLQNYSMVVNAAYSYYNVIKTFKYKS